jgi:O-antigen/teichoic acid export membrane protein
MDTQLAEKGTRNLWLLAAGGTAIVFGLLYLAENATRSDLDELWALAALPLVLAAIAQARRVYVQMGRFSGKVAGWALIGLSTAVTTLAFILGLDGDGLWAAFFISIGAGAILAAWR